MSDKELQVLQTFIWPQDAVWSQAELFLRRNGDVSLTADGALSIGPRDEVSFDTWFNLFNLGTWQSRCQLDSLYLIIEGEGPCNLSVKCEEPEAQTGNTEQALVLVPGKPQVVDLQKFVSHAKNKQPINDAGVMSCSIRSRDTSGVLRIDRIAWATADAPKRRPDLTLSVTTFKREAAVQKAAERFHAYREASPLKSHLRMLIIDNGHSVDLGGGLDGIEVIANPNLGGAGGFTRGLLEARDRDASHVLFMDDDASIHMETLERTWSFLAYAQDDATAISGAMSTERKPWALWEYGALFFKNCIPQLGGTNLLDWETVLKAECDISQAAPEHLYGGWWYFAFPVKAARHLAFPFFVRGDDVSFSIVNDFDIVRLNGVVSYQESFIEKESPLTWYLDLRSHLAHHLSIEKMGIGALGVSSIAAKFFLKNLAKMHYDTISAINLAVEDILQGPEFFRDNIDMSTRRGDLKTLTVSEAWETHDPSHPVPPVLTGPKPWIVRTIMKATLNGHLVPGYCYLGAKQTVIGDTRGGLGCYWGVSEMTVLSASRNMVYRARHSKVRAAKEGFRMLRNLARLVRNYPTLIRKYQSAYDDMTTEAFWRQQFDRADGALHSSQPPQHAGKNSDV